MQYVADAKEAKEIDRISIQEIGIPSLVLMEKAALAVAGCIKANSQPGDHILSVCGMGNNGGDGVAAARLLQEAGYCVHVLLAGEEKDASPEMKVQLNIARNLGIRICTTVPSEEYNVILDAIFGIGLSREVSGKYAEIIQWINHQDAAVYSVDIPSGVCATTGNILGNAVMANATITFGINKRGLILYPGCTCCGQVSVVDIGFPESAVSRAAPSAYTLTREDACRWMPVRSPRSNKGSYGKVLVIAGSREMSGACYFAAAAAFRVGCGLVKIMTVQENAPVIKSRLPEAIVDVSSFSGESEGLKKNLEWADVIVIGPGIGIGSEARSLLQRILTIQDKPVVIDADGLNLLSLREECFVRRLDGGRRICLRENFILTPHLKEMSRLVEREVSVIQNQLVDQAVLSVRTSFDSGTARGPVMVLKDAKTVVTDGEDVFINTTGNDGLATGGSGDVLAGMIGGLLAQGMNAKRAAALAVCFHGAAAEEYVKIGSRYSMTASDILEMLPPVLPK